MTTLRAVRRDHGTVRKLRARVGQVQAQRNLDRAIMLRLVKSTGEAGARTLREAEAMHGAVEAQLRERLAEARSRVAELETIKGAARVLWLRLIGRQP